MAYAYHFHAERFRALAGWRPLLVVSGLALVAPMAAIDLHFSGFVVTAGLTMLYLGYGLIVTAVLVPTLDAGAATRRLTLPVMLLAAVGRVSYPMYLWFGDVQSAVRRFGLPANGSARLLALTGNPSMSEAAWWLYAQTLFVLATVALGYVVTVLVERPGLALRDRLFPPRATAID